MKHFINISSAAALALALTLASCSNNDELSGNSTAMDNAIEVNAMIGNSADVASRAVTSSEVTTATLSKFWMSAFKGEEALSGTNTTLSDREFVLSNSAYTDGGTYYWPTGQVKFIAVSATKGSDRVDPTQNTDRKVEVASTGVTATNFSVETSGKLSEFVNQEDYIVAVNKTAKPSSTNKIDLVFQHMLSRVSINAYGPDFKTDHPSLASFAFDGVQKTGNFAYADDLTSAPFATSCWNADDITTPTGTVGTIYTPKETTNNTANCYWYDNEVMMITATAAPTTASRLAYGTNIVPWLNVIPGSHVATKLYATLWYGGTAFACDIDLSGFNSTLTEYKPGYQYIYNIKVKGSSDTEGWKVRPTIELLNITVAPWNSQEIATVDAPDVELGTEFLAQIKKAIADGNKNIEAQITNAGVKTLTLNSQVDVTANLVIDLNDHNITPDATDAEGNSVSVFNVSGGHRLAIKGTGEVNLSDISKLVTLTEETPANTFAIRGGTWTIDPKQYVPGYDSSVDYTALKDGDDNVISYNITCSSDSWNYTITRTGAGTEADPYIYTVTESSK